ncbi:hypothetical protein P4050_32545 [Pseudomonas aeruginosa]|nr:hypothetical protein [Pseudomonas aeruginosa]
MQTHDVATFLFRVEDVSVRAGGHPFGALQSLAQYRQSAGLRVVAENPPVQVAILGGVQVAAVAGDALHLDAVEQRPGLLGMPPEHRRGALLLADRDAVAEAGHAVGLGQPVEHRIAAAIGGDAEHQALAVLQLLAHVKQAVRVAGQGADVGNVLEHYPVGPAGHGGCRGETLPAEEGQGDEEDATEQAGDYYAALAQSFGQHSMHSRTKLPFIAMATEKARRFSRIDCEKMLAGSNRGCRSDA